MTKVFILTKRSFLIIFLVSNTVASISASTYTYNTPYALTYQSKSDIRTTLKNKLISKGLDGESAEKKTSIMFDNDKNAFDKLSYLYTGKGIALTKESVEDTFASYALFEKPLDMNSYESLVGFVQHIKPALSKEQLSELKRIASI